MPFSDRKQLSGDIIEHFHLAKAFHSVENALIYIVYSRVKIQLCKFIDVIASPLQFSILTCF